MLQGAFCAGMKTTARASARSRSSRSEGLGGDGDGGTGSQELSGEARKPPGKPGEPLALSARRPPSCQTGDSCATVLLKLAGSAVKKTPSGAGGFGT